jgi:hypothetical protein
MMRLASPSRFRGAKFLPLVAILALAAASSGQHSPHIGIPDDWSHRHVVFSNPGTAAQAIQNGTYARWARIVTDTRFTLQQRKREAAAAAKLNPLLPAPELEPAEQLAHSESPEEDFRPAENRPRRGVSPASVFAHESEPQSHRKLPPPRRRPHSRNNLHTDWSYSLGSGATLGLGVYPAKFTFTLNSASCASPGPPDFVVYGTSLSGDASHASIVAFDNLYVPGCAATPSVYWAYNTGGAIVTSVTFSLDGSQVAFVQSTASAASLVVLRWTPGAGTPGTPTAPNNVAANMLRTCTLPCMTVIPFGNGKDDTGSSVFPDYANDTIYVGDDAGNLHKFTGVFKGTPTEAGAPWPVSVSAGGEGLSSPVLDPGSGNILVGDYLISASPNCATAGCGFLYSVNAGTAKVIQSARLDYIFGLVEGPLIDAAAGTVYAFVGADSGFQNVASPCGVRVPCSGVFQLSTSFAMNASGNEVTTGNGFQFMLLGAPDNSFFTSANAASPTGHLYVVGNTGNADNTLYQIPIASNVMGAAVAGPALSTNFNNGSMAAGMGVTEIFSNAHDYVFTSVLLWATPAACTSSSTQGCVMGFDVTSGAISPATPPTGASNVANGASAIIIDNTVTGLAGASNIYYTPLADQSCNLPVVALGGCAIQISQSSP